MEKLVKVENISRKTFYLSLDFVNPKKMYELKPDTKVDLSLDEYNYLLTQCPNVFKNGILKIVNTEELVQKDIEVMASENTATVEDIEQLLGSNLNVFKKKLAAYTSENLVKDIRVKAVELNKNDKFIAAIDSKLSELTDGTILL